MIPKCPVCREGIADIIPDADGQIECPGCGGYYPKKWAVRLSEFEARSRTEERRRSWSARGAESE